MSYFLYIKNMVNPESFKAVDRIFKDAGLHPKEVSSGRVTLALMPEREVLTKLNELLVPLGFSIIDDNAEKIASRIKTALAELLCNKELNLKTNLSVYLSDKIHYEYHYLSTVFSDFENVSIEKYFIKLKIEKAKELIVLGDLTFSEIAYQLGYSSPAHFTNQFKQVELKSPTEYKSLLNNKQ
jgi:AraC-like DNA-binding protein